MTNYLANNLVFLRERKNINQSEVANSLGLTRSTYANYEIGANQPRADVILKIIGHFNVGFEDLLTKDLSNTKIFENSLVANNEQTTKKNTKIYTKITPQDTFLEATKATTHNYTPQVVTVDNQGHENVVFVPIKARAGYLNGYGDTQFINQLPAYRLPGLNNGTFRLFEVEGLSMYPTLNSGDTVIGKFTENLDSIRDDRIYVIVTKNEGVVVKRCLNRLKTDGKMILKSDNYKDRDLFPTVVISPEDIVEVWYATGFLSRQMRPPAEMYNRLIDLEGKFTLMEDKLRKKG